VEGCENLDGLELHDEKIADQEVQLTMPDSQKL
jgi:hypothetical protein